MERRLISSGGKYEPIMGYSRAVVAGGHVYVSGTAPGMPDDADPPADAYGQAQRCFEIILAALDQAGARAEDVVRTRIFVTDIGQWEAIGRAHGEVFGTIRPATAMVEVSRLIDPDMLVEIEADAVIVEPR